MGPWMIPLATTAISTIGNWALNKFGNDDSGGNSFSGTPEQFRKHNMLSKAQSKGLKDYFKNPIQDSPLYQQGGNFLSDFLNQAQPNYENFAQPYLNNFNEQIVPQLAERFAGLGTGAGAYNSSAFQNSLAQAGRGLQGDLASMYEQMKLQHSGQQLQGANSLLGYAQQPYSNLLGGLGVRKYENTYTPRQPGMADSIANTLPSMINTGLQGYYNQQQQGQNQFNNSMSSLSNMRNNIYNAS